MDERWQIELQIHKWYIVVVHEKNRQIQGETDIVLHDGIMMIDSV